MSATSIFFSQALIVVFVPYLVWRIPFLHRMIPLVVIQILLGIVLGPSLLGKVAPEVWQTMFTSEPLHALRGTATLAVVLFTFLSGLHLQPTEMHRFGKTFMVVSLFSMVVPTLLGVVTGFWIADLMPNSLGPQASPTLFAMAIGIACGVTALPVLGAILRENQLMTTRCGQLALGAAAANDGLLWVLLAFLLMGFATDDPGIMEHPWFLLAGLSYLIVMLMLVRPLLYRYLGNRFALEERGLVVVCTVIFGSALAAEWTGLHATLGGFMAGLVMPRNVAREIIDRLEPLTVVVLLPFFFTLTGMSTRLDLDSTSILIITTMTTVASMVGKIGGAGAAARWMGETWQTSTTIGILMQTKGMMEVVVLTIFLEEGMISYTCFSAMMLMAILTTALTTPMLRLAMRYFRMA